ncbi:hypothetical protein NPIL_509691 [Nephila pilipes]|uniref:Uncharacterized protein n=1 Tax=Nephila pilipes TaxID=299642 RepID=A0A8X6N545_NEPPI|nr:hypothetical protein NPIL_509691 [Nephila pilipes]
MKRSSKLQFDTEIRRNIQIADSSLDYLPEPIIPKKPLDNTRFCLNLLQPSTKKEDPKVLKQKGHDTIILLSKDNMVVAYTDGSSDKSLNRGGAGIYFAHPDGSIHIHRINTGTIVSDFTKYT